MTHLPDNPNSNGIDTALTRRRLLQAGGTGVLAIGLGGVLAACGSGGNGGGAATAGGTTGATGTPQKGGTLRIGVTGGGTSDILDAQDALTTVDFLRAGALNEQLMILNPKTGAPVYSLAESVESNKDATEWTIRVRNGVTFHDGKPLTAKDVLYSFERIKKNHYPGENTLGPVNLKAAKVMDQRTLRIPFDTPYSIFEEALAGQYTIAIVPIGYDPKKPIGTGPFKFKSFTPGQQSTFVRYDDYWQHGKPYLDSLVIVDFADETAQVNALQAGQVDLVDQLSYPSVAPIEGNGGKVVVSKSAAFVPFAMQTQTAPFDDVRVRQALRLLVDREQFNEQVFGGLGSVGNDIYGRISPAFKSVAQREQDIEQAQSLLKAAGQSDLKATLYSSSTGPGAESGAAVFASQAKAAGVDVKIETQPSTQFWGQSWEKVPFFLSVWTVGSYLVEASQGLAKGAPFPETQQADAAWQNQFEQALRTVDKGRREEISEELMKFDYEQGGYIIPVEYPSVEGMSAKVNGVIPNISGYAVNGGRGLQDIWMAA